MLKDLCFEVIQTCPNKCKFCSSNSSKDKKTIITLEKLFEKIPSIRLDNRKLELFLNGVMLTQKQNEGVYKIYNQKDEFIGTGTIKDNLLKRDIIL